MHWDCTLVDADWDRKIGYDKVAQLAAYGATRQVGLLLWYNSSGPWNETGYSPKSKLLTHEQRVAEFARLRAMGVKGVKIQTGRPCRRQAAHHHQGARRLRRRVQIIEETA